ncbi:hypothetical protein GGI35DRAFT_113152 [Trichoderma velutinum]
MRLPCAKTGRHSYVQPSQTDDSRLSQKGRLTARGPIVDACRPISASHSRKTGLFRYTRSVSCPIRLRSSRFILTAAQGHIGFHLFPLTDDASQNLKQAHVPPAAYFSSPFFLQKLSFLLCLCVLFSFHSNLHSKLVSYLFLSLPPFYYLLFGLCFPLFTLSLQLVKFVEILLCLSSSLFGTSFSPPADDSALFPPLTRTRPSR